jgi:primosomal protein N' (replication factor Y) (superfamily II helicase)
MFAEMAIPLYIDQTFTYRVPDKLLHRAQIGCRCLVPFGNQVLTGYIVAMHAELDANVKATTVREIQELIDEQPIIIPEILALTRWIAEFYFAPWGEVLKAAIPAGLNYATELIISITEAGQAHLAAMDPQRFANSTKLQILQAVAEKQQVNSEVLAKEFTKAKVEAAVRELEKTGLVYCVHKVGQMEVRPKKQNAVRLIGNPVGRVGDKKLTVKQRRILSFLQEEAEPPSFADLVTRADVSAAMVRNLERQGYLEIFTREVRRNPFAHMKDGTKREHELTPAQTTVLQEILLVLDKNEYAACLLHGVTGSGKTEIYLRAIRATLEKGKTALMLVPEIGLTPMFSRQLREHFEDLVAILHSSLSEGERFDEWQRIYRGAARVIIGTRSAIFAPLRDLGLVVIDEEHDTSYKQEETPRYNGRDSAIMRAHNAGAVVILGSATPSMESYQNAVNNKYRYLYLGERIHSRPLAQVEIIDMREVFKRHGKSQIISDELKQAIIDTRSRGEQTIILLNRRGYSSFLICRSCGQAIHCRDCDVTLTYHRAISRLICHYCNYQIAVPQICPGCQSQYIYYMGEGTEKLEEHIQQLFPEATVARLDRDTTRRRGSFERLINEFATGTSEILIGTQMVAKGHDFPNVTLVGVISVDAGLGMPDFRAAERTFQLLTQVAGRAGRGIIPGQVLIQTYHPDHYSLLHARRQDYQSFYQQEINFRQSLYYPPFSVLVNIIVQDQDLARSQALAGEIVRQLRQASGDDRLTRVLGPAPAPLSRLRQQHRFQILVKARSRTRAREVLDLAFANIDKKQYDPKRASVDVDPVYLL